MICKLLYSIYGGLQDNGSWMAPSAAPGGVGVGDWKAIYGGDGFWVVPDPTDPNTVYAESQGGDINRVDTRTLEKLQCSSAAQEPVMENSMELEHADSYR